MKIVIQLKLLPDEATAKQLTEAIERFNEAATWLAGIAFERRITRTFELQKVAYRELRERFGLPADMACRCLAQAAQTYNRNRAKKPKFRKHAAVPYTMRKNVGFKGIDRVSLATLNGRVIVPFVMGQYQAERFQLRKGQSDLVRRKDGKWFLLVTIDVPEGTVIPPTDFIGVDIGVTNILVDSDGATHSSKPIEAKRVAYASRRRALGRKTKGADRKRRRGCHRVMSRMGEKESRYRKDVNHQLSKRLVKLAQDTHRGIALEDLKGIRNGAPFPKRQRARIGSWAFDQLRKFIEYKAKLAGVFVATVDPRNTSRTCSTCGHCAKENRKSQAEFQCVACGHTEHADLNAARNIRARAVVNQPKEPESQRKRIPLGC